MSTTMVRRMFSLFNIAATTNNTGHLLTVGGGVKIDVTQADGSLFNLAVWMSVSTSGVISGATANSFLGMQTGKWSCYQITATVVTESGLLNQLCGA